MFTSGRFKNSGQKPGLCIWAQNHGRHAAAVEPRGYQEVYLAVGAGDEGECFRAHDDDEVGGSESDRRTCECFGSQEPRPQGLDGAARVAIWIWYSAACDVAIEEPG